MTIARALLDGIRRVNRAPALLAGVVLLTLLMALPLGMTLRGMIGGHLGDSLAAERAATGVNWEWWQEFMEQASGVGVTFRPTIVGFGAVLANVSALADKTPQATVVTAAATAYILVWVFLAGGILDRYARNRPTRAYGFFAASGVFFFRFVRLAILAAAAYAALYLLVHPLLFERFYPWAIRDLTVERTAFVLRALLYLVFGALLVPVNVLFDYAKVRAVVEDRRSMIGAMVSAARFAARRPGRVAGLYLLTGVLYLAVVALYAVFAPGASTSGWRLVGGVLIGQAYLAARLWVKLTFYASEVAFFQGELAHAGYTAGPEPVWPESPAAEQL